LPKKARVSPLEFGVMMRYTFEVEKRNCELYKSSQLKPIPNGIFVLNPNLPLFLENFHEKYEKIIFMFTRFFTATAVKSN